MTIDEYLIKKLGIIAPTYGEKPEDPEGEYLVVDLISSGVSNCLKSATVAVRSYADSLADASDLNIRVKAFLDNFWTDPKIARCKISTEYPINQVGQYKYQCVYDLIHYL